MEKCYICNEKLNLKTIAYSGGIQDGNKTRYICGICYDWVTNHKYEIINGTINNKIGKK
jgi:uncharacterized CHY-type Zn-finger protein